MHSVLGNSRRWVLAPYSTLAALVLPFRVQVLWLTGLCKIYFKREAVLRKTLVHMQNASDISFEYDKVGIK